MSVPLMQFQPNMAQAIGQPPSFSPPMMAEVNRQVYELPPQPQMPSYATSQPFSVPQISGTQQLSDSNPFNTTIGAHDIELLQLHSNMPAPVQPIQYQANMRMPDGRIPNISPACTSPASAFSGPPLENSMSNTSHIKRDRSMSCASRQSDCSASYRHDPYADVNNGGGGDNNSEAMYAESLGHRTPTPPPLPGQQSPAMSPTDIYSPGFPTLLSLEHGFAQSLQQQQQQQRDSNSPLQQQQQQQFMQQAPIARPPGSNSPVQQQHHHQQQHQFLPAGYIVPAARAIDMQAAAAAHMIHPVQQISGYDFSRLQRKESNGTSKRSTPDAHMDDGHGKSKNSKKKGKKEGRKAVCAMLVKFKHGREGEYYSDETRDVGTHVIIEGQRGQDLGVVASAHMVDNKPRAERRKRKVKRDATPEEVELWRGDLYREEEQALSLMKQQVTKHSVPIVVHRAEYQFDRKKLTFHYTTKVSKPDFRAVLHDGFRHFKIRIWMNNCDPAANEPGDRIDLNSEFLPVVRRH